MSTCQNQTEPMGIALATGKHVRLGALAWSLGLAVLSGAMSLVLTRDGPAIPTGDSLTYLDSARCLADSGEYGVPDYRLASDGQAVLAGSYPNTMWPPGLSALLACALRLGVETSTAVKWLTALFAACSAALIFQVALLITRSAGASLVISALMLVSFTFQYWVQEAWMAEGIYICATLGGILLAHRLLSRESPSALRLLFLGVGLSSTYYLKSAAPGYLLATPLGVLFLRSWGLRDRLRRSAWVLAGSAVGALPWLVRNLRLGTLGSGGVPREHPLIASAICLVRLFVPRHGEFLDSQRAVCLAAVFVLAAGCLVFLLALRGPLATLRQGLSALRWAGAGAVISATYVVTFLLVVAAGVVLHKASHVETRYWMEIAPLLFATLWVAGRQTVAESSRRVRRLAACALCVSVAVTVVANVAETVETAGHQRIRLPQEQARNRLRAELARLTFPHGRPVFITNQVVRFRTQSGLAAVDGTDGSERPPTRETERLVYVAYPLEPAKTMSIIRHPPRPPDGWAHIGTVGNLELYCQPGP